MSLATSNRDGGRTNEAGHLRGVTKGFVGQVLNGLAVSQRGAGANMSVDVAIGDAIIQRSDDTYGHPAWNDAVYNRTIAAADGSNPRRDIIVMYIDYGQTPSTGVANNTNGVVKIISVPGTAAGSPVDPSNATIQSAVGSGNPYVKLARVRVAAGATSISNSVIDDLRLMATAQPQGGWIHDAVYSWVYASASTFTIAGVDARAQFPVGTKIRIYQSGSVKYFYVTANAFSTNTTITLNGGGTYTLANVPIDKPAYSYALSPQGYPLGGITPYDIGTAQFPRFRARKVTAANVSSTLAVVVPDTVDYNVQSVYNNSNGRFTAPVTGYYHFDAAIGVMSTTHALVSLYKNGAEIARGSRVLGISASNIDMTMATELYLTAGDYIQMFAIADAVRAIAVADPTTWFNGNLVALG